MMTEFKSLLQIPQWVDTRTGEILTASPIRAFKSHEELTRYQRYVAEYSDLEASAIVFGDVLIGGNVSETDEERALLYQYIKKERLERERRKEALYKSQSERYALPQKPPYWTEKLTRRELGETRKLFRAEDLKNLATLPEGSFVLDKRGRAWWKITFQTSIRKLNGKCRTETLYCR